MNDVFMAEIDKKFYRQFLNDFHWQFAVFVAIIFWIVYGIYFNAFSLIPIEEVFSTLLFSVLIYPVLEEIVFRGGLQTYLFNLNKNYRRNVLGVSAANIATSVVFVLVHFIYHDTIWSILIFFPSLVFGYFRDRFGRIIPSIILHSFYNLGFVILFY